MDGWAQSPVVYAKIFQNRRGSSSGREIVAMMQAAELGHGYNLATCAWILIFHATGRRSLGQRKMSSVVVVITSVLIHQTFQMPFIEDDHMIEQVSAVIADLTLGHSAMDCGGCRPL